MNEERTQQAGAAGHQGPDTSQRIVLGAFEYAVLRAIVVLGDQAYGAEIGRHLSRELGRDVTAPQVYMTLSRLTKRGFVSFVDTDPVPERGGRSRKRFNIEAGGVRALRKTSAVFATSSKEVNYEEPAELPA
jgi:PadR family transcriptional regulator, regulatory protein PadR